jgi:SAM-dependent methyltransferase
LNEKEHWEQVYSTKRTDNLGWFAPHLEASLSWINRSGLTAAAPIIDVGGGASTLVDDLLDSANHRSITVLDISAKALSCVKARLGKKAKLITWLEGDITTAHLPAHHYELWHDRAVFHFLTELEQQRKYRDNLLQALKPGGHLIIGTFAPEAPPQCSGLPVLRYTPDQLENTLGTEFVLERHCKEMHITPGGVEQMYLYCYFRRTAKRHNSCGTI